MKKIVFVLLLLLAFSLSALQAQDKKKKNKKDYVFTLSTRLGDISFVLYEETPIHKSNFLKLTEEGLYDSTTFHRVINNFMVQGGDLNTRPDAKPNQVKPVAPNESNSLQAEILPQFKHKRGAIAAFRLGDRINPQKRSNPSQFYLVHNADGSSHLDGGYTVFGQVIQGLEVVDAIAGVKTSRPGDRPLEPVFMTIKVKKMSKRRVFRVYGYVYE